MKFTALGKVAFDENRAKYRPAFEMSDHTRDKITKFFKENPGIRITIEPQVPESKNQRAFYHGAVIVLWAYLDGKDYRDSLVLEQMHEIAKREFNGEIMMVNGTPHKVSKSTKGLLNKGYLERVIDYLVESYGIDQGTFLNPEIYKKFRDEIYPYTSKYETFIDYMRDIKLLK